MRELLWKPMYPHPDPRTTLRAAKGWRPGDVQKRNFGTVAMSQMRTFSRQRSRMPARSIPFTSCEASRLIPELAISQEQFAAIGTRATVAQSLGVFDVGLAKACRTADIPTPPRRWWAKLQRNKPSGHGLGMAIAQSLVEASGGALTLTRSALGGLSVQVVWAESSRAADGR